MVTTLIVEDNVQFRKALKEALLHYFPAMEIEEASEGVAALRIVQEHKPKIIFMDIRLPGESGLVLTGKIKAMAPETNVIILTAYDSQEYLEAAAEAGATCFAVKDSLQLEHLEILVREMRGLLR